MCIRDSPTRVQAPEGAVTSKVQAPRGALTIYIHYFPLIMAPPCGYRKARGPKAMLRSVRRSVCLSVPFDSFRSLYGYMRALLFQTHSKGDIRVEYTMAACMR